MRCRRLQRTGIVQLLLDNHDEVEAVRVAAQRTEAGSYQSKVLNTA